MPPSNIAVTTVDQLISDREQLERILAEYNLLRAAIRRSPMPFCVYDEAQRLVVSNDAYDRLHPAIGRLRNRPDIADSDITYGEILRTTYQDKLSGAALEEEVSRRLDALIHANGEPVERHYAGVGDFRVVKFALPAGGTAGLAVDITELKAREAELTTATTIAEAASLRAESALMAERLRKRAIRSLSELGEWLQSCKSLEELFSIVSRFMGRMFPTTGGELYVYSNSRDVLDKVCLWNIAQTAEPHIQPDDCWALRRGRILRFGAGFADLACAHAGDIDPDDRHAPPYACIPIIAHGDTVGLLHMRFVEDTKWDWGSDAREDLISLAIQCAEQISLAIANVKLRDELQEQSTRDPLTGLYNRRHFMNCSRRAVVRAQRADAPLSIVAVDVDQFKKFNDQHGHDAGDQVLSGLGAMMMSLVPEDGVIARFGGEEFAALLPDMGTDAALSWAESLRHETERLVIAYGAVVLPKITLSCGIASLVDDGTTFQQLLRAADGALYRAKDTGRNRVCAAGGASIKAPLKRKGVVKSV